MKKIIIVATLVVVATAGVMGYQRLGSGKLSFQKNALKPVAVRLAWVPQAQFAGMYVAKDKGLYAAAGLDVALDPYVEGSDVVADLRQGKTSFIMLSGVELLIARSKGEDVKAVAAVYQVSPYAFVSLQEKSIKRPEDLKGKVLGAKGGNNEAATIYKGLLNLSGISSTDVMMKNLDFGPTELDDLISGRADVVDLYRTDQLYLFEKDHVAYDLLLPERYGLGEYGDILVTSEAFIKSDPDTVRKFVQATLAGWQYALDHRDEALAVVARHEADQYKDPAYERRILDQSAALITPTGGRPLGIMDYGSWKRTYTSVKMAELLENNFDVSELYTNDFIR